MGDTNGIRHADSGQIEGVLWSRLSSRELNDACTGAVRRVACQSLDQFGRSLALVFLPYGRELVLTVIVHVECDVESVT